MVRSTIRDLSIRSALWALIVGSVLSILSQFSSNRLQHAMEDGCQIKLGNVVSGEPQGSVIFNPCTQFLYTVMGNPVYLAAFFNKLHGYADDSTLLTVVP